MNKSTAPKPIDTNSRDKQFLTLLANRLRPIIRKVKFFSPVRDLIHNTPTGGIRTTVAQAKMMRLELWYDQYVQYPKRRLWYGYYWSSQQSFDAAFGHWREYVQRQCVRWDSDATSTIPYHFKKNLEASEFGRPFLEHYRSSDEYFFGCFDLRSKISDSLITDISNLVHQTLTDQSTITVEHIFPRKTKILEKLEVQRLTKALKFDRASSIAKERKKRDGYRCHICKFDFAKTYPGLGAEFAEAHHLKPLGRAKRTKVKVTVGSLLTLCANCHRMVHRAEVRLRGNPIDHVVKAWRKGVRTR